MTFFTIFFLQEILTPNINNGLENTFVFSSTTYAAIKRFPGRRDSHPDRSGFTVPQNSCPRNIPQIFSIPVGYSGIRVLGIGFTILDIVRVKPSIPVPNGIKMSHLWLYLVSHRICTFNANFPSYPSNGFPSFTRLFSSMMIYKQNGQSRLD